MKNILLGAFLIMATLPAWCGRNREPEPNALPVHLRDAVEVKRSAVWLSDLLPPGAPSGIEGALASIELCPAPQPGSVRLLDAEQVIRKLAGQPEVLRQLVIPARISVRFAGWLIPAAAVRRAISEFLRQATGKPQDARRDLPDAANLEWPPGLSATEEHPRLEVVGTDWDSRPQAVQVRLRCSTRAACGSFLVRVILPSPLAGEWGKRLASGRILASATAGLQPGAIGNSRVLAEKGKPATLILEDGGLRLSVRVICLQAGVLNQKIRVIEARSGRVFHAEVVDAGLLHSTL